MFIGAWAFLLAAAAGVSASIAGFLREIGSVNLRIGSAVVSFGAVGNFVGVILATWAFMVVVRFVLEEEVLPRLALGRGIAFAVSTTVRYGLALGGFFLAVAAAGIDLSRVTLLAGALGVGIGFGMQNVVNNFVSGLIMLLERPIQVGDTIEVGGLVGEVKRIGIRSSTVRTTQGAEVVVPNGDLISKNVVNWTMSDPFRRLEIDVGVAYGTEPDRVTAILQGVAKDTPDVLPFPAPTLVFTAFGDSSLNFRLLASVRFESSLHAQSVLRRNILDALDEAGISIPFPQRDLRVIAPA